MLRISGEMLRDHLFRTSEPGRWYRIVEGIPADAEFVRMAVDWQYGNEYLCVVYRHPSFPKHYPGNAIYELNPPMLASYTMETPTPIASNQPTFTSVELNAKKLPFKAPVDNTAFVNSIGCFKNDPTISPMVEEIYRQRRVDSGDAADKPHIVQG